MDILLSVIIPVYNAKKTISRCLESVLTQRQINIEVICVDDESTDETLQILESLSQKDSRIRIVTKENGGVASARNAGLKEAKGKYVTFVDQDDWVEINSYATVLASALETEADMAVFNYTKDFEDRIVKMVNRSPILPVINSIEDIIRYAFYREEYRGFAAYVWNKFFKRDFLEKYNMQFGRALKRGDDVLFISHIAVHSPKTIYIDKEIYHYVQREDSITHTMTKENLHRLADILIAYQKSIDLLEEKQVKKEVIDYMKCFYVFHAADLYELAHKEGLLYEQETFRESIKKYLREYKHQNACYKDRLERIDRLINNGK